MVDLEIFEHTNTTTIKKFDKKEFYITNLTKNDNKVKKLLWDAKDLRIEK